MTTRIFHMSDPHWGIENRQALEAFARVVHDERPDAVLCTGDITQRAKLSEFEAAAHYFAELQAPVIVCAGNHDMPYYNLWERFTDPYRRFRALHERAATPFQSEDVVLVALKTTVRIQPRFPWSDGVVMRSALKDCAAHLTGLADDPRIKLVYAHHPLLPGREGQRNPTIGGDAAFAQLASAGAQAIASGHVHVPFDLERACASGCMRMLGAGTLSMRLRSAPPSYQVLTFTRGQPIARELRVLEEH